MTAESTDTWAGWYRDRRGAEAITFHTGKGQVQTRIRGVDYSGGDFATLAPVDGGQALASCVMEWDVPLQISLDKGEQQATLSCLLTLHELGSGAPAGRPELNLTLHWAGAAFESGIAGGGFEEALDRLRRQLPGNARLGSRPLVGA
jgi:hypothetical protein